MTNYTNLCTYLTTAMQWTPSASTRRAAAASFIFRETLHEGDRSARAELKGTSRYLSLTDGQKWYGLGVLIVSFPGRTDMTCNMHALSRRHIKGAWDTCNQIRIQNWGGGGGGSPGSTLNPGNNTGD